MEISFSKQNAEKNKEALYLFLDFFSNNATQISKYFNISVPTVSAWKARGRISRKMAERIHADETLPFSREQLRSDIRIW